MEFPWWVCAAALVLAVPSMVAEYAGDVKRRLRDAIVRKKPKKQPPQGVTENRDQGNVR